MNASANSLDISSSGSKAIPFVRLRRAYRSISSAAISFAAAFAFDFARFQSAPPIFDSFTVPSSEPAPIYFERSSI